jgi:hypothetical protein
MLPHLLGFGAAIPALAAAYFGFQEHKRPLMGWLALCSIVLSCGMSLAAVVIDQWH